MLNKASDFRVFDNGGKTLDRYTIIPARKYYKLFLDRRLRQWEAVAASETGAGFLMSVSAAPGPHLGKRIDFDTLHPAIKNYCIMFFND